MKPSDVTQKMVQDFDALTASYAMLGRTAVESILAAAYNAIHFDDGEKITAEWLLANGFDYDGGTLYTNKIEDGLKVFFDPSVSDPVGTVSLGPLILFDTKTIGQLKALCYGLGVQPLKEKA